MSLLALHRAKRHDDRLVRRQAQLGAHCWSRFKQINGELVQIHRVVDTRDARLGREASADHV
jgi:hypothetical protein